MQMPFYPGFYPGNPALAHPSQKPNTDGGYPGINLKNHVGGVGMEPGYNYIFPTGHCKVHVFKTKTPPWQADAWSLSPFDPQTHVKLMVPTNVHLSPYFLFQCES